VGVVEEYRSADTATPALALARGLLVEMEEFVELRKQRLMNYIRRSMGENTALQTLRVRILRVFKF
jgi:hypothetical protein